MTAALYPPQVNTFMPAFIYTEPAVVYYSVSPYNDFSAIKKIHISVVDSVTNQTAIDYNVEPSGLFIRDGIGEPDEKTGLYKVEINPADILNGFQINRFYKVQLRFDNCSKSHTKENGQINSSYLIDEREYFSEWSSVCLIRPISELDLKIRLFSESEEILGFNKGVIPVTGNLVFKNSSETDYLQSYNIQILDASGSTVYVDSGNIYPVGASNNIDYRIDVAGLEVEPGTILKLKISYVTKNQYENFEEFPFQIVEYIEDEAFNPTITTEGNVDDGSVKVTMKNSESVFGILYIKRSSNHTHYREWETVYSKQVAGPIDIEIVDNTVASTDWYRYSAQLENPKGGLSPLYKTKKIILDFHDAILSRGSRQFAVRFNYQISSFKPVVNRAKIDTLGGKYPKFAENAQMNYKQFSVTGLISAQADFTEAFFAKTDFFNAPELRTYEIYNHENDVIEDYDYLWEREFREEAIKWLNDGKPKLYRSQTEGNLIVMVTDVNLTPNKILSRRIWDFSATIYEIGDGYNMRVLHDLGIYNIYADGKGGDGEEWKDSFAPTLPNIESGISAYQERIGQKYYSTIQCENVVEDLIGAELKQRYTGVIASKIPNNFSIRNVKIFFHSKPHIYIVRDRILTLNSGYDFSQTNEEVEVVYGYRMLVNGQEVFVNEHGYYQIPNDIKVTSLVFPDREETEEEVTIEYIVGYDEKYDTSNVIAMMRIEKTVVGQLGGSFGAYDYLLNNISKRYSYKSQNYVTSLHSLRGLCVDVQPYAILKVKYIGDNDYNEYLVGMGGVLHLLDDGYAIKDFCFAGRKMIHYKNDIRDDYYLEPWEYSVDENEYSSLSDIQYPIVNRVYTTIDGLKHIFHYDRNWYRFVDKNDGTGIAEVPIEGVVNYYCDVLRGDYNNAKNVSVSTNTL